jgi:transcriptional regulator with XRE-family HTH domain
VRIIDRLQQYIEFRNLSPYAFERACGLANGYLGKQLKGRGRIGSEILEKIHAACRDLNLTWLVAGEGEMIVRNQGQQMHEGAIGYTDGKEEIIRMLRNQVTVLEVSNSDKDKIIALLETQLALDRNRFN